MPYKPDPEREARVALGVGLIAAGETERAAARIAQVPQTSLHRAYHKALGPDAPNRTDALKAARARIQASAYAVAEQTIGRMADEVEHADHGTLRSWADSATKALARLEGWGGGEHGEGAQNTGARLAAALERLASGKVTLTMEPARAGDDAVDVTPSGDE